MAATLSVMDEGAQRGERQTKNSCYISIKSLCHPSLDLYWLIGLENERGDLIYLFIFFYDLYLSLQVL